MYAWMCLADPLKSYCGSACHEIRVSNGLKRIRLMGDGLSGCVRSNRVCVCVCEGVCVCVWRWKWGREGGRGAEE